MSEGLLVVEFEVGAQRFALPAARIREILRLVAIRAAPGAPPHVRGAMNLRGAFVTVADLRVLLGVPAEDERDTPIVIVDGDLPFGLVVDEVFNVEQVDAQLVQARHPSEPLPAFVSGVYPRGAEQICCIDPDLLVQGLGLDPA